MTAELDQGNMMMSGDRLATGDQIYRELLNRMAVAEIIQRERAARDAGSWDEMASYHHPESFVDVAWFKGSGADFVSATQKNWRSSGNINFHDLGAPVITINGDRAIAETACTLHGFYERDGIDVASTGYTRLLWRTQRLNDRWLIAGLRCVYIRDMLQPCNPDQQLSLNEAELATYRPSYRYLTATLKYLGRDPKHDLPGFDQPETVVALREAEQTWLRQT